MWDILNNAFGGVGSKAAEVMSGMDPATQGDPSLAHINAFRVRP
ncbi:MAG: hypothetical protein ACI88A_000004 [Paraglaciecola sp.]|jgi:hypothetical protein